MLKYLTLATLIAASTACLGQTVDPVTEPNTVERQYNAVWNGLVHATMNQRYHAEKARQLDVPPSRVVHGIAFIVAIICFALPIFLETQLSKSNSHWPKWKTGLLVLGVLALTYDQFLPTNQETVRAVVEHQVSARQWNNLATEWTVEFEKLYWHEQPIAEETLLFLKRQQANIDASEQDTLDKELLRVCQEQATAFLIGSLNLTDDVIL